MSLYRSEVDWALVFEVFGFSPRAGLPHLCVCTFGSRLRNRNPPESYVSREAYENYLSQHPNDDSRFFYPIAEGDWQSPDSSEFVSAHAEGLLLRDEHVRIPPADQFRQFEIALAEAPRIQVFELCRLLAAKYPERVLATEDERRVSVPEELTDILQLGEWAHPRSCGFTSVQVSANPCCSSQRYSSLAISQPIDPAPTPNTHWRTGRTVEASDGSSTS